MSKYLHIVNNRIDDLVKITINERKLHGLGVLFIDFGEINRMDVRYVALHDPEFPGIVRERYIDRMNSVPNSVIFLLIYDGKEEDLFYEVDLDKNSTFYKESSSKQNEVIVDKKEACISEDPHVDKSNESI